MLLLVVVQLVLLGARAESDPISSALCRARCIHQLVEPEPRADRDCATQPDCFLCWEHCGTLSSNNSSKEILCNDNQCSPGCRVACDFFKETRSPTKERLVFPDNPTLNEDMLEWAPVPNATLYSVSLVYLNRTMQNIAQTVSCKLKISKVQLSRVTRIVVIAVNNTGALGIANYNLVRKIVKKNVSSTILKLRGVIEQKGTLNFPSIHNPVLWVTQGEVNKIDESLIRTKISWKFIQNEGHQNKHEYLIKWLIPDLNMEGKSVVNGSRSTELTYLFKYICLVKVKVMGSEMESQILVLKNEQVEMKSSNNSRFIINTFIFVFLIIFFIASFVVTKLLNNCKFNENKEIEEKSIPFCNV